MSKYELIQEELEEIAQANNGLLFPVSVVKYAKDEDTTLHSRFDWDDTSAAHAYRLEQARRIIRMHVTIIPEAEKETRMFVSLMSDRIDGGGYRYTLDVMSDLERRKELLGEAHRNFKTWQKRYTELKELSPVFEAMDTVFLSEPVAEIEKIEA